MRIAIDARPASHPQPGGFKRYTEQLLYALAQTDTENQYLVFFDRAPARDFFAGNPNFRSVILPSRVPALGVIWREQWTVPQYTKRAGADVIHFTVNSGARVLPCPLVVTMHDIIFWDERPALQGLRAAEKIKRYGMYLYNRWAARVALQQAQHLITVSEYSKQNIVTRFGIAPGQVSAIYPGLSDIFRPLSESEKNSLREQYNLRKPFLLGLCSASPRKNTLGLLEAYAALEPALRETYELVLVWTHGLYKEQVTRSIQAHALDKHVRSLHNVSDADLVGLMNLTTLFVFPSLDEGFGLPPLEAMACGAPVVASNRASLPEVLGDAAVLTDASNARIMARSIAELLEQPARLQEYRARGLEWVARYSWRRCARETIQVYASCARTRMKPRVRVKRRAGQIR
jgi:glycosyltransferase involved in cell wall biosynthesis